MLKQLRISIVLTVLVTFIGSSIREPVFAQEFSLPAPGAMVHLSPEFTPPMLKGIKVYPDNPFLFDFILDKGDSELSSEQIKDESNKLIKYFLASLTTPEKDLWVNLSPYEKDRIIPQSFGLTEMGRDLLGEDYILKQITASLVYPEEEIGKKFWKRVYEEAQKKFGTTNVPVNTFNKVWIIPEQAVIYENAKAGTAYIVESKLKVMLEQDYLSLEKHNVTASAAEQSLITNKNSINALGSQIVREIVIPELTTEVNENKNFARLRQVYDSLILATWYKNKIKDSILAQVYVNKNKVAGVNIDDPQEKEKIYQQYLRAFKKGVYNYIKEEVDPLNQQIIPRKYFSGGLLLRVSTRTIGPAQVGTFFNNQPKSELRVRADVSMTSTDEQNVDAAAVADGGTGTFDSLRVEINKLIDEDKPEIFFQELREMVEKSEESKAVGVIHILSERSDRLRFLRIFLVGATSPYQSVQMASVEAAERINDSRANGILLTAVKDRDTDISTKARALDILEKLGREEDIAELLLIQREIPAYDYLKERDMREIKERIGTAIFSIKTRWFEFREQYGPIEISDTDTLGLMEWLEEKKLDDVVFIGGTPWNERTKIKKSKDFDIAIAIPLTDEEYFQSMLSKDKTSPEIVGKAQASLRKLADALAAEGIEVDGRPVTVEDFYDFNKEIRWKDGRVIQYKGPYAKTEGRRTEYFKRALVDKNSGFFFDVPRASLTQIAFNAKRRLFGHVEAFDDLIQKVLRISGNINDLDSVATIMRIVKLQCELGAQLTPDQEESIRGVVEKWMNRPQPIHTTVEHFQKIFIQKLSEIGKIVREKRSLINPRIALENLGMMRFIKIYKIDLDEYFGPDLSMLAQVENIIGTGPIYTKGMAGVVLRGAAKNQQSSSPITAEDHLATYEEVLAERINIADEQRATNESEENVFEALTNRERLNGEGYRFYVTVVNHYGEGTYFDVLHEKIDQRLFSGMSSDEKRAGFSKTYDFIGKDGETKTYDQKITELEGVFTIIHPSAELIPDIMAHLGNLWVLIHNKEEDIEKRKKALAEYEWWFFQANPMGRSGAAIGDAMSIIAQIDIGIKLRDRYVHQDFDALSRTLQDYIEERTKELTVGDIQLINIEELPSPSRMVVKEEIPEFQRVVNTIFKRVNDLYRIRGGGPFTVQQFVPVSFTDQRTYMESPLDIHGGNAMWFALKDLFESGVLKDYPISGLHPEGVWSEDDVSPLIDGLLDHELITPEEKDELIKYKQEIDTFLRGNFNSYKQGISVIEHFAVSGDVEKEYEKYYQNSELVYKVLTRVFQTVMEKELPASYSEVHQITDGDGFEIKVLDQGFYIDLANQFHLKIKGKGEAVRVIDFPEEISQERIEETFQERPELMVKVFQLTADKEATISDRVLRAIAAQTTALEEPTEAMKEAFYAFMKTQKKISLLLLKMYQVRLLGKFLPEFETLRYHFEAPVHRFSVPMHSIYLLYYLENIMFGDPRLHEAQGVYNNVSSDGNSLAALRFAILCHDAEKEVGGASWNTPHPIAGSIKMTPRFLSQFPDASAILPLVKWLVWYHQEWGMRINNTRYVAANNRSQFFFTDLVDTLKLAEGVLNQDLLNTFYLLTLADAHSVDPYDPSNPYQWTFENGKYQMTTDLFVALSEYLRQSPLEQDRLRGEWKQGAIDEAKRVQDETREHFNKDIIQRQLPKLISSIDGVDPKYVEDTTWLSKAFIEDPDTHESLWDEFTKMYDSFYFRFTDKNFLIEQFILFVFMHDISKDLLESHAVALEVSTPYGRMLNFLVGTNKDEQGIMYKAAGALAAMGFNILGAQINTSRAGIVFDQMRGWFIGRQDSRHIAETLLTKLQGESQKNQIQIAQLDALLKDRRFSQERSQKDDFPWERMLVPLLPILVDSVINGTVTVDEIFELNGARQDFKRSSGTQKIRTEVNFEDDIGQEASVFNLQTADRNGLLYVVSRILSDRFKLNIRVSPVNTYQTGVEDRFEVTKDGKSLTDEEKNEIKRVFEVYLEKEVITQDDLVRVANGGDVAQFSEDKASTGGIDLSLTNKNLQTQNAGEGIKFHIDQAMLQKLQNAPGFRPFIIDIQTVNLRNFLGVTDNQITAGTI